MDNVLTGGGSDNFFRRSTAGDGCRRPPPPPRSIYSSFTYAPPFLYTPYQLYSSVSLPLLPYANYHPPAVATATKAALLPYPPPVGLNKYSSHPCRPSPAPPATGYKGKAAAAAGRTTTTTPAAVAVKTRAGDCKRKKPRTPSSTTEEEPPRAPQRRRPLERAAPLPPAPAVTEALDDLEREVTRGFVEDLLHALAPPPSSLPLPTFSLVRAAAAKAAASCAAV